MEITHMLLYFVKPLQAFVNTLVLLVIPLFFLLLLFHQIPPAFIL